MTQLRHRHRHPILVTAHTHLFPRTISPTSVRDLMPTNQQHYGRSSLSRSVNRRHCYTGCASEQGTSPIFSDAKAVDPVCAELTIYLRILCDKMAKVESFLSWLGSAADQLISVKLERCHGSLKELEAIIAIVQESVGRVRLYKGWVQVTWSCKQKQIEAILANISQHKCTLTLTLGCVSILVHQIRLACTDTDYGLGMADVKQVIHTLLESKTIRLERNEPRGGTMEQDLKSPATSFYSAHCDLASNIRISTGSCVRTIRSTPKPARSNDSTCTGSEDSEPGFFLGTSSSIMPLLLLTNQEFIQIPASQLGPALMGAEKM